MQNANNPVAIENLVGHWRWRLGSPRWRLATGPASRAAGTASAIAVAGAAKRGIG
jgi:hypothetical protein